MQTVNLVFLGYGVNYEDYAPLFYVLDNNSRV